MTDASGDVRFSVAVDAKLDGVTALATSIQSVEERVAALNGKFAQMSGASQQAAQATANLKQQKEQLASSAQKSSTALADLNSIVGRVAKEMGVASGSTGQLGTALSGIGAAAGPAGAGIAALTATIAGLTVGLAESGKAAEQQRQLLASLMATSGQGAGFASVVEQLKGMRVEAALVGATFNDLNMAFRREFAESRGSVTEAMETIRTGMKIAAITGEDLKGTIETVGRAADGNLRSLRQFGIFLSENQQAALKSMSDDQQRAAVMKLLNDVYKDGSEKTSSYAKAQAELNTKIGELRGQLTPAALNIMTQWTKGLLDMATHANSAAANMNKLAGSIGNVMSAADKGGKNSPTDQLFSNPVVQSGLNLMTPSGMVTVPIDMLGGAAGWTAEQIEKLRNPPKARGGLYGQTFDPNSVGEPQQAAPSTGEIETDEQKWERVGALKNSTIPKLATEAKTAATKYFDALTEDAKQWRDTQIASVDATEKALTKGLETRQREGQRALQAESQAENDRYQEQVRLIGLREEAELKGVETRRTAEDQRHTQAVKNIETERDADIKAVETRRDANLKAIDDQRDAENSRFEQLGRQRQDEDRAQQRAFQQRQTEVRQQAEEETDAERQRSTDVLTHLKDEKEALTEKHKTDLLGIQQTVDAAKMAHDERLKLIEVERDSRLSAIDDELRAMDKERQAAQYAKQSADASTGYADANKKLADARKAGATPEEIARLEREVNQAREREAEIFTQHQYDLRKQALEDEKTTIRQSADAQKQAADDELKAVEAAERQKRDALNDTYEAQSKLLDKAVEAERDASQKAITAINARRDAALAAIQAEQTNWEDWRTTRDRQDQDDHRAILGRIADARENTAAQYRDWIEAIRTTAQEKISQENTAHTGTMTNLKDETDAIRDRYSSVKEGGERYEAALTHKQITEGLSARRQQFDDDMRNEREQIAGNAEKARTEIDRTWGDKPGGAQHTYKLMRDARLEAIDQLKKDSDDAKDSADKLLTVYGQIAEKLREIAGLGGSLKAGASGAMPTGDLGPGAGGGASSVNAGQYGSNVETYAAMVAAELRKRGVPEQDIPALTAATLGIMQNESGFDPTAENYVPNKEHGVGLMQVDVIAGTRAGQPAGPLFDPAANIAAAVEDYIIPAYQKGYTTSEGIYWYNYNPVADRNAHQKRIAGYGNDMAEFIRQHPHVLKPQGAGTLLDPGMLGTEMGGGGSDNPPIPGGPPPIALPFGYGKANAGTWGLSNREAADPAIAAALRSWNALIEQATAAEARHRSAVLRGEASILEQQHRIQQMRESGKASAEELEAAQKLLEASQTELAETNRRYGLSMATYKEQLDGITAEVARFRGELQSTGKQLGILATSANSAMMALGATSALGPQVSSKPFSTYDQIKAFNDKFGPRLPLGDMLPGENPLQWQENALLQALGLNYYGMKFGDQENPAGAIGKINYDLTHQSGTAFAGGKNDPMGAGTVVVSGAAGRGAVVTRPGLWKIAENPGDTEVIFNLSQPGTYWNVIAQAAAMGGAGRLAGLAEAINATVGAGSGSGSGSDLVPQFAAGGVATLPGAGGNYSALATRPALPRLGGPLPQVPGTTVNVAMSAPALPPIAVPVTVQVSQGPGGQITATAQAQAQWQGGSGGLYSSTSAGVGGAGGSYAAQPLTGALRGAGGIDPQAASLLGTVGNWQPFDRGGVGDLRN